MTARDRKACKGKVEVLRKRFTGARLEPVVLDLMCKESMDGLVESIKKEDKLDILVNNSGVYFPGMTDKNSLELTMQTNYHGTKYLTEKLLDKALINKNGKIVFVSSGMGKFDNIPYSNPLAYSILKRYQTDLKTEELDLVIRKYEEDFSDPNKQHLWHPNIYSSSKLFISLYSMILGRDPRVTSKNIQVYSCCPGYCHTDMTKNMDSKAYHTYLDGGRRVYNLISNPKPVDPTLQGRFFNSSGKLESLAAPTSLD